MSGLFAPQAGPRVFALPPGVDFARELVAGLETRLAGQPPEAWADVEIWLNTQRARRRLADVLAAGPPRLLPRLRVVTELADDPDLGAGLPPGVSPLARQLDLARLVGRLLAADPQLAPAGAAFDLAQSLSELFDEMAGEGVEPAAFARLDVGAHAAHWARSRRFLSLLVDYAGTVSASGGQGRLRHAAAALAARWRAVPPAHPVLVAGSTGSRAATRLFMEAVAGLPQGAILLPGLDDGLPAAVWDRLGAGAEGAADHPQHGFRLLADAVGFDPRAVPRWTDAPPPAPVRNALLSLALRPAPVTDQWRRDGAGLAGTLHEATGALDWVEAPDPRAEARVIAYVLRDAAEIGRRAALVTPDRTLARRVTAELGRWDLAPDDSAGRPLALTPPGVLLGHLANLSGAPLGPATLLALLKHPLTASGGGDRGAHLDRTARLEHDHLRGGDAVIDWAAVRAWAGAEAADWAAWVEAALAPMLHPGPAPLAAMVARHRNAAERLVAGPAGAAEPLWQRGAGEAALAMMTALAAEAEGREPVSARDYRSLVSTLMASRDVPEEAVVAHPLVSIWGTLEARVQSADLIVLGGLNEGTWPRLPSQDPWLNRAMRQALGLPSPERRIGLSAHDFQQAAGAASVVLTRAARDADAPTVPARWLLRLENLLGGLGEEGMAALDASRRRGDERLAQAALLDDPPATVPPASRPSPSPPVGVRPRSLSVTQIETLTRDPYAVYARKVLKLTELDPIGPPPPARARGIALHAALERFVAETEALGADAADRLVAALDAAACRAATPAQERLWSARFRRSAAWFADGERARRARAAPLAREVRGTRRIADLPAPFEVTATADRIDRAADGGYAIYDYKAGGLGAQGLVADWYLQLPLEAAIAESGGFDGVPAGPVRHLELIGFGAQKTIALDTTDEASAEILARLAALVARYQDPDVGYVARLRPALIEFESAFDHLARFGEWADGAPVAEDVA